MNFEWNQSKSDACFAERGFDFGYAARAFFDPDRVIHENLRHSYGEDRYQLMGKIEQRVFVVVYTPRNNAIRIISARKANQREVRQYENSQNDD
ncbi:BrnT family toxin [Ectothiorhodospira lacustris]|uniref:BrnT family toxin n=1 Tax=Ectothiorhodospira lacustris TaxID=2899127 RepID=UPI001EE901BD|nr:BrnT family toxin [Ectothiorhodospira lacustris]MCG5502126.1 BrnT family toxin [Ectothiorhodospira lacustris]MCG5509655.1 BrnT family toxin [Ectothiorhodospira lacustris]MCG5521550.1 BrnT family toxin [Ectothiorhodospira lacustris]